MSFQIPPGYSASIPLTATFGPDGLIATDTTTSFTNVTSTDDSKVVVVYPDPTPGASNPLRSVRVDMKPSTPNATGATISVRYTSPYDGTVRTASILVTAIKPPDAGTVTFGTPSTPFLTPTS